MRKSDNHQAPPLTIAALSLSFLSLSRSLNSLQPILSKAFYLIAVAVFLIVLWKLIYHRQYVQKELRSPIIAANFSTFFMAGELFILTLPIPLSARQVLALAFSMIYLTYYLFCHIQHFQFKSLENLYPSWFVLSVGIATSAITLGELGFPMISRWIFNLALIGYCITLPLVSYRLLKHPMTVKERPLLALYVSPPSLLLVTYLTSTTQPSVGFASTLFLLSQVSYLLYWQTFLLALRQAYTPIFLAFTFPAVIRATASHSFHGNVFNSLQWLSYLWQVELLCAILIVIYISFKSINLYAKNSSSNR